MAKHQVPTWQELLWPTLEALRELGGSASIQEIADQIASILKLSDATLDVPHNEGSQSEFKYRAAWSRTALKKIGAVSNTSKGVWAITEIGRQMQTEGEVLDLAQRQRVQLSKKASRPETRSDAPQEEQDWQAILLNIIRRIDSGAFEHLCQRVLREAGFTKVEVTGRSGDGGIDGYGVLKMNLISFPVLFQCKRYTGSVSSSEICDFRGAMVGRADKGLLITTGRYTKGAERESIRDGAPPIDLIDGIELCEFLKKFRIGVSVRTETIEEVAIDQKFFEKI